MAIHAHSTIASENRAHHRSRRQVEARIDELIALLDAIDDDPDLEDGDDAEPDQDGEPTLGWPEAIRARLTSTGMFVQALGGESEDGGDREPSLGSLSCTPNILSFAAIERATSQLNWAGGGRDDRERDAGDEGEAVDEDGNAEEWQVLTTGRAAR